MQPGKKLTRREKDALSRQAAAAPSAKKKKQRPALPYALLAAVLGFLLYANTLGHEFTLDDMPAITGNKYVTEGLGGIDDILHTAYWSGYRASNTTLYRPVPLLLFALEWQFFPNRPSAFHAVSVLLYALTGFLLFRLLHRLFPG